jgi:preprotein translocase subunit YajC
MSIENVTETATNTIGTGGSLISLLPMVVIFAIFYFFLIRPQVKRQRQVEKMVSELKKGDKVVAAGGIHAIINKIEGDVVSLEVAENTKIKVAKSSITEVISSNSKPANDDVETEKKPAKKATKPKKAE